MRIAIFDNGAGNVHSLAKVLSESGAVSHTADVAELCRADLAVLPGVGAFDPAMDHLGGMASPLADALRDGLACLAICLGMQLLFESSDEGERKGLGLLEGRVERLVAERLPNIGWECVDGEAEPTLGASGLRWGYYANSFVCPMDGPHAVTSTSTVESSTFPATLRTARTLGVQFHPEKSSARGVAMVRAFCDEVAP
ncbi:MAG TPA: imidazole glycerol phosphate synthase subunit HisH [Acidimicrobiales bacterium]|jgi:glutamine amidotransferase